MVKANTVNCGQIRIETELFYRPYEDTKLVQIMDTDGMLPNLQRVAIAKIY